MRKANKIRKIKSKLAKVMEEDNNSSGMYTPTIDEAKKWIRTINREVFNGKLPKLNGVEIRRRRGVWADCTGNEDDRGKKIVVICLNHKMKSRQHFIEVIAHELVHHWEYSTYGTMAHTEKFYSWKNKLGKFNIPLNNYTDQGKK